MGEDLDLLTADRPVSEISNRGIVIVMVMLIALGTIGGFVLGGSRTGGGLLIGGILAMINYFWLDRSTKALFAQHSSAPAWLLATKYILRYVAIGGVLLLIYTTGVLPMVPVILGLSAFAIAVVLLGLKNIFTSSF